MMGAVWVDLQCELLAAGGMLRWESTIAAGKRRRSKSARLDWLGLAPHTLRREMGLLTLGFELDFISKVLQKYPPFKALLKNPPGRKKKSKSIIETERLARSRARDFMKSLTKELVENPFLASLNRKPKTKAKPRPKRG